MLPDKGPRLTADEFAILPWGWTPGDAQILTDMVDCGFNLAGFVNAEDLDLVQAAGMKAIVSHPDLTVTAETVNLDSAGIDEILRPIVAKAIGHPARLGYYLFDEPHARLFPGLGRWRQALERADHGALAYINLYPIYAQPSELGTDTYDEHLQQYIEQVQPAVISYDNYSLKEDGSLRNAYFPNLESIHAAAQGAGIPFWNIVLCNAHFNYAEPSPAWLRFQSFTTLAYGGRGISHFTYLTPDVGNFRSCPVNARGEKTPVWEMLREVNLQVHSLAATLIHLRHRHVFHKGEVPTGSHGFETAQLVRELSDGPFAVGEFEAEDGQPYALVVNRDLQRSYLIRCEFKIGGKLLRVSPYSGKIAPVGMGDMWLAPGQGVLLAGGG